MAAGRPRQRLLRRRALAPGGRTEKSDTAAAPLTAVPSGLTADDLRRLYRYMLLQRFAEDRIVKLYYQGAIVGACFTGYGHEAIAVGAAYALGPQDVAATLHRDLGARLVLGMPLRYYFANFLGRTGSPTRGREGNLHIGGLGPRILLHIDHIGASIPVAAGAALGFTVRRDARVAMAFFGEGTLATGEFHEGANLAAVLRLPLVLVCWNNQFAYSTPVHREVAGPLVDRMAGYGMDACSVDGNDVLAVYEAARRAVNRARERNGPSFLECRTMRMRGHSEADDASYVPKALIEEWRRRDPVDRLEKYLAETGLLPAAQGEALRAAVLAEVDEAQAWAEACPPPDPAELEHGVYCEGQPWP
ncbi:MAG TPA: thiamine pyrophosphate-dependent dehydrogenase E1 component subunit alpha [bacterium]|nr:thiamine pyrophosphate-dependent dehydrogenase E1 component subunit alpha [bacterium]